MTNMLAIIGTPFIPSWQELRPFVGELWLIVTIVAVLLTPFFVRRPNVPCALVSLAGLTLGLIGLLAVGPAAAGPMLRPMLVNDPFSYFWKVLLLIFVIGVVLMWFSTTSKDMHEGDGPEFFTLLLGATLGMSLMGSASNLLMLVMAVEMASLPSYVLAGFRKTDTMGAEASLKYVLFGAATSAIMIYGVSMLYGLYGTLQIDAVAQEIIKTPHASALLTVALFGVVAGIGFKISLVPLHFWCPDVFEGAGIDVAAFLSVASKGAAMALLLRVLMTIASAAGYQGDAPHISLTSIAVMIGTLGAITATVGNTAAFVQTNIKRLLAYSSISHAGYMMCALSLLVTTSRGFDPAGMAAQAILLYLAVYLFMNLGAFTVAGVMQRQVGSEQIEDYTGLGRRNPLLAGCMAICMLSLVGLPPFAGFLAKLNVMYVLGANGGWWWVLVAVIGLNTVFSLYYYVRVIKVMYLRDNDAAAFYAPPLGAALATACAAALVLLFVFGNPLWRVTSEYGKISLSGRSVPVTATIQSAEAR